MPSTPHLHSAACWGFLWRWETLVLIQDTEDILLTPPPATDRNAIGEGTMKNSKLCKKYIYLGERSSQDGFKFHLYFQFCVTRKLLVWAAWPPNITETEYNQFEAGKGCVWIKLVEQERNTWNLIYTCKNYASGCVFSRVTAFEWGETRWCKHLKQSWHSCVPIFLICLSICIHM